MISKTGKVVMPFLFYRYHKNIQGSRFDGLKNPSKRTHDAIIMLELRQNDVAMSFWRNNDVTKTYDYVICPLGWWRWSNPRDDFPLRWNRQCCDLCMAMSHGVGPNAATVQWPIYVCMRPANKRWLYNVMSSLIGWAHTQNDLRCLLKNRLFYNPSIG